MYKVDYHHHSKFSFDGKDFLEDICKKAEDDVQKLTDNFIKKIDELLAVKEAEIMKV